MGNTSTKEARSPTPTRRHNQSHRSSSPGHNGRSQHPGPSGRSFHTDSPRRGSRPDFSFLGITNPERDTSTLEHRRETKQEREARKLEKERAARLKERERSMKEEHVDGGYLVTQGVYVGTEDFNKQIVRQLMIERRIAPFWRGLNDFSDSWAEHQLMAAARGMTIPAPDDIPPELQYKLPKRSPEEKSNTEKNIQQNLMVPISSRSQSYNSDTTSSPAAGTPTLSPSSAAPSSSVNSPLFRGRAKTLASLTTSSKNNSQSDMSPRELQLPPDQFVNGQPIEVYLYKNASECPICFLYYPPYLNQTRCCDQPICSECFVQIKRADPHPPEHEQNDPNAPAPTGDEANQTEGELVTEPAACPFCVQPEFGVTYNPPPFRRGLTYATHQGAHPLASAASPMSSSSSLSSGNVNPQPGSGRRRAVSLSANAPTVITTDKIRPDWASKLISARAHAARRSAAATALHTAAYLMQPPNGSDSRGSSSRRGVLRRTTGQETESPPSNASHLHALSLLSERRAAIEREHGNSDENAGNLAPPRGSSRRNRVDDLEEMMMMEAIRLSLASEEERRKKEEKEAKKAAKKKEKEAKKAEKSSRKHGLYSNNASTSALTSSERVDRGVETPQRIDTTESKGKEVDRSPPAGSTSSTHDKTTPQPEPPKPTLQTNVSNSSSFFQPSPTDPQKRSHLRHMSSASSSASSLVESTSGEQIGSDTHGGESMFNFRSLAAVIGDEEKCEGSAEHAEHSQPQAKDSPDASSQAEDKTDSNNADTPLKSNSLPTPIPEETPNQVEGVTSSTDDFFGHKELQTNSVELLDEATKSSGTTA
ncbi:SNF1-interacting protein [Arachnomyces sp. PD_36]|nr:SNF1-interacting protein [Arachnomyces sp. PD_36]